MQGTVDWSSVDMLISQLSEYLNPQEDLETIMEAKTTIKNRRNAMHQEEVKLQNMISDLQKSCEDKQGEEELSRLLADQRNEVEKLEKEKEQIKQSLMKLQQEVNVREEDIKREEEEYMQAISKCNKARDEASKTKQNIKQLYVLYHEFTKIKWNYDSTNIAGYMTRGKFNDVIDFDIDPNGKSEYDIANLLWDLMEGEEEKVIG